MLATSQQSEREPPRFSDGILATGWKEALEQALAVHRTRLARQPSSYSLAAPAHHLVCTDCNEPLSPPALASGVPIACPYLPDEYETIHSLKLPDEQRQRWHWVPPLVELPAKPLYLGKVFVSDISILGGRYSLNTDIEASLALFELLHESDALLPFYRFDSSSERDAVLSDPHLFHAAISFLTAHGAQVVSIARRPGSPLRYHASGLPPPLSESHFAPGLKAFAKQLSSLRQTPGPHPLAAPSAIAESIARQIVQASHKPTAIDAPWQAISDPRRREAPASRIAACTLNRVEKWNEHTALKRSDPFMEWVSDKAHYIQLHNFLSDLRELRTNGVDTSSCESSALTGYARWFLSIPPNQLALDEFASALAEHPTLETIAKSVASSLYASENALNTEKRAFENLYGSIATALWMASPSQAVAARCLALHQKDIGKIPFSEALALKAILPAAALFSEDEIETDIALRYSRASHVRDARAIYAEQLSSECAAARINDLVRTDFQQARLSPGGAGIGIDALAKRKHWSEAEQLALDLYKRGFHAKGLLTRIAALRMAPHSWTSISQLNSPILKPDLDEAIRLLDLDRSLSAGTTQTALLRIKCLLHFEQPQLAVDESKAAAFVGIPKLHTAINFWLYCHFDISQHLIAQLPLDASASSCHLQLTHAAMAHSHGFIDDAKILLRDVLDSAAHLFSPRAPALPINQFLLAAVACALSHLPDQAAALRKLSQQKDPEHSLKDLVYANVLARIPQRPNSLLPNLARFKFDTLLDSSLQ